jgi:hypothetical protein
MPEAEPGPGPRAQPPRSGDESTLARVRGAAPVPEPPPRRKRWLDDASGPQPPAPPAPQRDSTPHPPVEERTPVDPWADVDPLPVAPPPLPVSYPPTRPYTAPQPIAPQPIGPQPMAPQPMAPQPIAPQPIAPPPVAPVAPRRPAGRPAPAKTRKPPKPAKIRPVTPPPGWRPPVGYVAVPVRRRRKWPWVLLVTVVVCCACPAWFGQPLYTQYPASATVPDTIGDLTRRDDPASERAAAGLKAATRTAHPLAESTFAALYTDPNGKLVKVFGTTGLRWSPDADAQAEIDRHSRAYGLEDVAPVRTAVRGEARRCGVGTDDGDSVVVCTWADHGSLGTGVFSRLDVQDSNAVLTTLRDQIVTRGG